MKSILSPIAIQEIINQEKICFVDVRSHDEFKSGHVPNAICIPLESIEMNCGNIPQDGLVVLSCQSGKRSAKAYEILHAKGFKNLAEMDGGFSAWTRAGLPIKKMQNSVPIFRQVLITAGSLVLLGTVLGTTIHPNFYIVPALIGAGQIFAGISGWCGMAILLEYMPWNNPTELKTQKTE